MTLRKITAPVIFVLIAGLVILSGSSNANAAKNPYKLKLPFKSAIIKYEFGGIEVGTSEVYYKGKKSAEYKKVKLKLMGLLSTRKTEILIITAPDSIVRVDLKKRTATATGNQITYMAEEFEKLNKADQETAARNHKNLGKMLAFRALTGMPQLSTGTFLGKPVDIVSFKGDTGNTTQVWTGTSIVLKSSGIIMGFKAGKKSLFSVKHRQEAISIEENAKFSSDKLEVPEGIEVIFDEKADKTLMELAKGWVRNLADPEFEKNMTARPRSMAEDEEEAEEAEEEETEESEKKTEISKTEAVKQKAKAVKDKLGSTFKKLFRKKKTEE